MSHFWGKVPINSSFYGNLISDIYGENTKRSFDIPNGYISEQNGMFYVFLLNSAQKVGIRSFYTNLPKIAHISVNNTCRA